MTINEKESLAQFVIDTAKKYGADEMAVNISNDSGVDIQYRDGEIEQLQESQQSGLSIQVYTEHKYSSHSTNDLNRDNLKKFIEQAVLSTKYLTADKFRSLPNPKLYPTDFDKDLNLFDHKFEEINTEFRLEKVKAIYEAAKSKSDKIISVASGYGDSTFHSLKVHSNGFSASKEGTSFSVGAEVTVRDGDARPEDWYYTQSRFKDEIPDLKMIGEKAADGALSKIGQTKVKSGKYSMLVENRAAMRLISMLMSPLSAAAIQQKSSYLDGMLYKSITSNILSIVDDPFIPKGLGSRIFDGQGIASQKRTVIEKGILKTYFVDDYYGRKLGLKINGGSSSNFIFETGNKSFNETITNLNKAIWVTSFNGGNSNSTTGDFSFGISGFLIEKGQVVKPINEMNISGNAKDFWKTLVEMVNDPYPYSKWQVPSMLFDGISFSGL
ncbi:MAG: TldD/PmbA family protein [Bacteroidetes bacterium]|nr:MAG: TldD/PmbA family protein [Bacteroidota bacterium]RLD83427.1 MAG: TldD/PmbA family protein [Bacteroidota bacterium]